MEDKFDEMVKEMNLDDIEDFDVKPAKYQVWYLGYDADHNITDYAEKVIEFNDPQSAISHASCCCAARDIYKNTPENVKFIEVVVETVVDIDGVETNVGTLFSEIMER